MSADLERAKEIAGKLNAKQAKAVRALSEKFAAGPNLPFYVTSQVGDLQDIGIVEKRFGDFAHSAEVNSFGGTYRCSACWWFRLHPTGLAVRRILEDQKNA